MWAWARGNQKASIWISLKKFWQSWPPYLDCCVNPTWDTCCWLCYSSTGIFLIWTLSYICTQSLCTTIPPLLTDWQWHSQGHAAWGTFMLPKWLGGQNKAAMAVDTTWVTPKMTNFRVSLYQVCIVSTPSSSPVDNAINNDNVLGCRQVQLKIRYVRWKFLVIWNVYVFQFVGLWTSHSRHSKACILQLSPWLVITLIFLLCVRAYTNSHKSSLKWVVKLPQWLMAVITLIGSAEHLTYENPRYVSAVIDDLRAVWVGLTYVQGGSRSLRSAVTQCLDEVHCTRINAWTQPFDVDCLLVSLLVKASLWPVDLKRWAKSNL